MELSEYKYRGARALVLLHEHYMHSFMHTWRQAKSNNVTLPVTEDKDYESLETLLMHVLRSSGGYIKWICAQLGLDDPGITAVPSKEEIESGAEEYLKYVLDKWRKPLADVEPARFEDKVYKSNWGVEFCIDAMLEHAVMHPIRHEFQLKELILGMNE